ncbi:MAG: 2-amino-4-hydroxy-6-hydroxymethyldihydropteridine diphosphokinase [Pseudomonadota bacterium]
MDWQEPKASPHAPAIAVVAMGSNLGDRRGTIDTALVRLERIVGACMRQSPLIETEAWIHPDDDADWHPPFLNGVAVFESALEPLEVLDALLAVETALGRQRHGNAKPWQPRPIDLDLIAVNAAVIDTPRLILPHPRMHERRFVLEPLASVLPAWRHPILGKTAGEFLELLPEDTQIGQPTPVG